jgi:hypothetical protein
MDEEESCETCRFFQKPPSRMSHGDCRRYPHNLGKLLTEWCGEYRRLEPGGSPPLPPGVRAIP